MLDPNAMKEWEQRTAARLRAHLQTHVPPLMQYYQRKGGPSERDFIRIRPFGQYIAEHGDIILFPTGSGSDEEGLAKIVEGVAILAFAPGGITLLGLHFDASELPPEENGVGELHALMGYFDDLFNTTWHERYSKKVK